jgi:hypothetical protein
MLRRRVDRPELHESLVETFTQAVMNGPFSRRPGETTVQEAPAFSSRGGEILCTCDITGSTNSAPWDGTSVSAEAFARTVGNATASLVARKSKNHKYAWLYAGR